MAINGYDLTGRVALVTGGAEGIGAATALLLAQCGADVAVAGRTTATLERTAGTVSGESGRRCLPFVADATDEMQVQGMIASVVKEFGRLDILVNNVGWGDRAPLATCDTADWHKEFRRNLDAAFFCAREAFEHLKADGGGCVVNNSSVAGVDGVQGLGAYSVSKSALRMFTKVAAAEWGRHGVRVNAV
ncbi:MAG: SDR family oxidoreductase, partial [Novosphingobium sp.]|nr:SDR family oxidoreductase [Novosphingobium sp.]